MMSPPLRLCPTLRMPLFFFFSRILWSHAKQGDVHSAMYSFISVLRRKKHSCALNLILCLQPSHSAKYSFISILWRKQLCFKHHPVPSTNSPCHVFIHLNTMKKTNSFALNVILSLQPSQSAMYSFISILWKKPNSCALNVILHLQPSHSN